MESQDKAWPCVLCGEEQAAERPRLDGCGPMPSRRWSGAQDQVRPDSKMCGTHIGSVGAGVQGRGVHPRSTPHMFAETAAAGGVHWRQFMSCFITNTHWLDEFFGAVFELCVFINEGESIKAADAACFSPEGRGV